MAAVSGLIMCFTFYQYWNTTRYSTLQQRAFFEEEEEDYDEYLLSLPQHHDLFRHQQGAPGGGGHLDETHRGKKHPFDLSFSGNMSIEEQHEYGVAMDPFPSQSLKPLDLFTGLVRNRNCAFLEKRRLLRSAQLLQKNFTDMALSAVLSASLEKLPHLNAQCPYFALCKGKHAKVSFCVYHHFAYEVTDIISKKDSNSQQKESLEQPLNKAQPGEEGNQDFPPQQVNQDKSDVKRDNDKISSQSAGKTQNKGTESSLEPTSRTKRYNAEVVALQNVYLNHRGQIFDDQYYYRCGGCELPFEAPSNETLYLHRFTKVPLGVNLVLTKPTKLFYTIGDFLPSLYLLKDIISRFPTIPIFVSITQDYLQYVRYLGLDETRINFIEFNRPRYYYFVKILFSPSWPECRTPPNILWNHLRKQYLETQAYKLLPLSTAFEPNHHPFFFPSTHRGNLSVTIYQRELYRVIPNMDEVLTALRNKYPKYSIKLLHEASPMTFAEKVDFFSRTQILIGVHGSELANMIFMPKLSGLVEISPKNFKRGSIRRLAIANRIHYAQSPVNGDWNTIQNVDPAILISSIDRVLKKMYTS